MKFSPRNKENKKKDSALPANISAGNADNFDDFDDFDDIAPAETPKASPSPAFGFGRRGSRASSKQTAQPVVQQASDAEVKNAEQPSIKALYRPRKPVSVPDEQRVKPEEEPKKPAAAPDHPFDDWGDGDPRSAGWKATVQQEQTQKKLSLIDRCTEKINSLLNRSRPQPNYYIPADAQKYVGRTRYKTRNRKPIPMWMRATLTTAAITVFYTALVCLVFSLIMGSRVNYTGGDGRTAVRISGNESNTILLEQTEELENTSEFTEPNRVAEPSKDVEIILVASSSRQLDATASAECDALMLVAIDYKNDTIKLIPIMRDLYVRIEGYVSNRISRAFYYDTASGNYSLPTLRAAIEDNLGIIPDHYVVVDSGAFITLVTRVGGVSMDLTEEEALYMSTHEKYGNFPRYTAPGNYLMTGAEALNYIRMKDVGNGEYDRTVRQRAVLEKIFGSLNDMSFVELCETAYAMLPLLPTDMTGGDMLKILMKTRSIMDYDVSYLTIPITGSWRPGTATVLENDIEVMVTDFSFTADALSKYLFEDDRSYINGTAASGITIPDVAPYVDPNPPVVSQSDVPAEEDQE